MGVRFMSNYELIMIMVAILNTVISLIKLSDENKK